MARDENTAPTIEKFVEATWELWCRDHNEDQCTPEDFEEVKKGALVALRRGELAGIFVLKLCDDGQTRVFRTTKPWNTKLPVDRLNFSC